MYYTCEIKVISLITLLQLKKLHWKCWYETITKSNVVIKLYTCEIDHKLSHVNFISNCEIINESNENILYLNSYIKVFLKINIVTFSNKYIIELN